MTNIEAVTGKGMKVVELKCPNCGAVVSRETMKFQYCGASVILSPDGSGFSFRKMSACPKCGNSIADDAWICGVCGKIITKDVGILKELQKKIRFEQERTLDQIAEIREKIEPDEYVYFCVITGGLLANKYFVATDKKLIKYEKGVYWEAPWSEVVSIGYPQSQMGILSVSSKFSVNTFHERVTFDFGMSAVNSGRFYATLNMALNNHNLRKKDIRALLCFSNLGDEEDACSSCGKDISMLPANATNCPYCGKHIEPAVED